MAPPTAVVSSGGRDGSLAMAVSSSQKILHLKRDVSSHGSPWCPLASKQRANHNDRRCLQFPRNSPTGAHVERNYPATILKTTNWLTSCVNVVLDLHTVIDKSWGVNRRSCGKHDPLPDYAVLHPQLENTTPRVPRFRVVHQDSKNTSFSFISVPTSILRFL